MSNTIVNISLEGKNSPTVNIIVNEAGSITSTPSLDTIIKFVATGDRGAVGAVGAQGSISGTDVVTRANIAPDAIGVSEIENGTITNALLAPNSVYGSAIPDGSIGASQIANNSITADEIVNGSITADLIADGAISRALLDSDIISANEIEDKGIYGGQIANNTLVKSHYVNNSVDGEIIEDDVTLGGTVTMNHLELAGSSPALVEGPASDDINIKTHSLINFQNTSGTAIASLDQSGNLTLSGTVDGVDIATDVAANTSKSGITSSQSSAIIANTAKETNTTTNLGVTYNSGGLTITSSDGVDTPIPAATISTWGAMTGSDKTDVAANTAKVTFPGLGTTSSTALAGNALSGDVAIGGDLKSTGNAEIGDAACDASGGLYAVAVNNSTTASSKDAFACGELTTASGRQAFASGFETIASGEASATFGAGSTATGERSFAQGQETIASGVNSVAINAYSDATGDHSFASGYTTCASGVAAVAFGASTVSSGDRTFATGGSNVVSGDDSAAFGNGNTAASNQSLAIGQSNTTATTYSSGVNAFVGGYGSTVTSNDSFVFGSVNIDSPAATGNNINQFLIGNNLKTPQNVATASAGNCQFVIGKFNDYASMPHNLFTVGNGADEAGRNNAFVIGLGGNVGIGNSAPTVELDVTGEIKSSGDVTVGGDLTVLGNDIKDDDGTTCITFDSSGNTTIANALTVTDLTITDDLSLGDDVNINATGILYLAGAGNGEYISSTSPNTISIVATSTICLDADVNIGGDLEVDDGIKTNILSSRTDTPLTIMSKDDIDFVIDSDNSETGKKFTFSNGGGGGVDEIASIDESGNFQCDGSITAKQRHILNCGWNGNSTALSWLPFGYGGTGEAFMYSSNAGYLESGGIVAPCDGYIESIVIRCEEAAGSTEVGVHVAPVGTEVPTNDGDSFISPAVNMSADDTGYKFSGFVDDSSNTNSFSAGDVIMISFDPTSASGDSVATAVLVLDWNNIL